MRKPKTYTTAKTRQGTAFDAIIDETMRVFYQKTFESLDAVVEQKVANVKKVSVKLGREFFRTMARGYMRQAAPGPFKKWAKLNPEWQNYKSSKLKGSGPMIYYGIRPRQGLGAHLRDEIASKNANVLFGSPRVKVKPATDLTGVEGDIVPIEKAPGKFQFAKGATRRLEDGTIKKIGGQWVTPSARVTVELFPRIRTLTAPEIFGVMRHKSSRELGPMSGGESESEEGEGSGGGNWIQRLAGNEFGTALGGKVPARPLLAPFMEWWLQNTGFQGIEEALR